MALFARNPRGATLTEAGKDFVLRAREILQRAQALQAEMSFYAGLRKGSLNLGIITSLQCINFGGMLSAFCGSYPDISVNIVQEGDPPAAGPAAGPEGGSGLSQPPPVPAGLQPGVRQAGGRITTPWQSPVSTPWPVVRRSPAELRGGALHFPPDRPGGRGAVLTACRRAGFAPDIVCRSSSPHHHPLHGPGRAWGGLSALGGLPLPYPLRRPGDQAEGADRQGGGVAWRRDAASPWWTPQSSSPGSGSNDRPLLSSFPLSLLLYNRAIPLRRSFL